MITDAELLTLALVRTADWTKLTVSPDVTPTKVPPVMVIVVVPSYTLVTATVPVTVNTF